MPHGDMRGKMNKARVAEAVRGPITLHKKADAKFAMRIMRKLFVERRFESRKAFVYRVLIVELKVTIRLLPQGSRVRLGQLQSS